MSMQKKRLRRGDKFDFTIRYPPDRLFNFKELKWIWLQWVEEYGICFEVTKLSVNKKIGANVDDGFGESILNLLVNLFCCC